MVAAGGTGGHLFPAQALAVALARRAIAVELVTDARASRYGHDFPARATHLIASATPRAKNPLATAAAVLTLARGVAQAWRLFGRARPAAIVGFGGYPTIPPLAAGVLRAIPTIIHDANAVIGRANRLLAPRVTAIAATFPGLLAARPALASKTSVTGNPVRPAVVEAASMPYDAPRPGGALRLLVFGGSQGARVMADVVVPAIELVGPALRSRLSIVQQTREEDMARVGAAYARIGVDATIDPFFADLPARMAASHLVIARSGASTVAELAAIGRPAILVPLPHALDQDQLENARVLERAGGAICLAQDAFTPRRLAELIETLAGEPQKLVAMAAGARAIGAIDAAERLAVLVMRVAGLENSGDTLS
ncbi:MAG: UDP-N-acetylglucosamine--N-acetylmuramyl-(pentapeptide) pyrophosphoryl-undecaprenol N-acetylglucosamine transferase [Proteobacteria bacterium]|nr:UDP-N-acetylglucosamine--N-acetylmuramyl-(pentapeptide) pyrophosphoryl-undecaprenol N-acetylglucosamine transferase [Pseudomonadota bacterium]